MTSGFRLQEDGQALLLSDEQLEVRVLPSHGGKIVGLVDRQTGRDWLWKNPYLESVFPAPGDDFVMEHDTGGFDECFPAVSEGPYPVAPWQDRRIPDHGELWAVPWGVERTEEGLLMVARTTAFPVCFERRISLRQGCLRLDYRASNPTEHPFPFIWSAHPLFALEEGMRIDLPEGHALEVFGSDRLGERHTLVSWPHAAGLDLSRTERKGWSAKLAGPSPERGWVGLTQNDRTLRLTYDPAQVTDIGLWLNMGGWCPLPGKEPYFNLGLEPCIGWGDDLAYAVSKRLSHGVLPPHGERRWVLELKFGAAGALEPSALARRAAESRVG
jgi:galactose mutarotase-like enzyme